MASSNLTHAPKILLAKPGLANRPGAGGTDDDAAALRANFQSVGSLNLLSDSWEFQIDRLLPFLTDNTEFTVVGVIGPTGVGKSTILNEVYGFDSSSPGLLPPFGLQSEETRALARHLTVGIEPRVSSERIILLDTQPVFSPSVLAEMIRPDGSSTVSLITGESLSAELVHEMMSILLGVLLASICHVIIVVSEGVSDTSMWRLMTTVDLLKHGLPDPSSATLFHPQNKEGTTRPLEVHDEYIAAPVFVHNRVHDEDDAPINALHMKKMLIRCFGSSSYAKIKFQDGSKDPPKSSDDSLKLFLIPSKRITTDSTRLQYQSFNSALWKLRDQILSMPTPSFSRTVSERDWLKNSAKIWELIKSSPIVADYCRMLQSSGLYRK